MIKKYILHYEELLGSVIASEMLIDLIVLLTIVVVALFFYFIARKVIIPITLKVVTRTPQEWDDILFAPKVLKRFGQIFPFLIAYILLRAMFVQGSMFHLLLSKVAVISLIISVLMFVSAFSGALLELLHTMDSLKGKSLKGVHQVFQILLIFVGLILVIATIANQSPLRLLAGLGASAAILLLIFKDTILGFVSGVQLSANDMLRVGDWITVPKYGADGDVIEITLNTVKVRNFDKTISMVPPYVLVNDSFQNWRGMERSGGRRATKSVNIDLLHVKFCTPEMIERLAEVPQLKEFMLTQKDCDTMSLTNLTLLRRYLIYYLDNSTLVNHKYLTMVRQLKINAEGLPLELYFFTATTEWTKYENDVSSILEHTFAIIPIFDLHIYERAAYVK